MRSMDRCLGSCDGGEPDAGREMAQHLTQREQYAVHIHSPLGPLLGSFDVRSTTFTGPDPGFGVRCVAWGPQGGWLAVGGMDGKVRILEQEGWRCIWTSEDVVERVSWEAGAS